MKLPLKLEYACRVLAQLGKAHPTGKLLHIDQLAQTEAIPKNYLVQILSELRSGGLNPQLVNSASRTRQRLKAAGNRTMAKSDRSKFATGSGTDGTKCTGVWSCSRSAKATSVEKALI